MPTPPPPLVELMKRFGVSGFDELYGSRIGDLSRFRKHGIRVITGVDSGMGPAEQHGNSGAWSVKWLRPDTPRPKLLPRRPPSAPKPVAWRNRRDGSSRGM